MPLELSKKHYYIFRVKCDKCSKMYVFKIEFHLYLEPEWLIKSIPIKNMCDRCKVIRDIKVIRKKLNDKEIFDKSQYTDGTDRPDGSLDDSL